MMGDTSLTPGLLTVAIEQRPRKKNLEGVPIEIEGRVWILPSLGFSVGWTYQRDRLYEESLVEGKIFSNDVDQCAFGMFAINYDQTGHEILALIGAADREELVKVVVANTLNATPTEPQRSFTYYARTALRSAGLDPDKIPPEECAGVLAHLVGTQRILPHEEFTRAGEFANTRNELLSLLG